MYCINPETSYPNWAVDAITKCLGTNVNRYHKPT